MTLSISIIRASHHPRALFFFFGKSPGAPGKNPRHLAASHHLLPLSTPQIQAAQNPILPKIPYCTKSHTAQTWWHPDQGPAGKFSGCLGWSTCAPVWVHSISNVIGDFYKGFLGVHPIFRQNQPATLRPLSYLGTGRASNSLLSTHFPY